MPRLSPYGGLFSPFESLSAIFFSMWGPFCYVFLLMVGHFHRLKAFLLLFFLYVEAFLLLFFLYVEAFLLRFSCGWEAFFHLLKAFLLLFFSMWGCCFYGNSFWLARKYKKAKRSGREDHWEQYKEFQKVVQAKLTEGRWDYINRFVQLGLETGNKKPFWKYLRV